MNSRLKNFINKLEVFDAFVGVCGVIAILTGALVMQIYFHVHIPVYPVSFSNKILLLLVLNVLFNFAKHK